MKKQFGIFAALFLALTSCDRNSDSSASGTIETDEVRIASRYGGRVERIFVQEGDALKPGQVLAELEAAELSARRDQVRALLAEQEAGARKEELAAAKAEWEARGTELDLAKSEWNRIEELFRRGVVSDIERDRARSSVESLGKTVAAAKSRYELLVAGTRPEQITQTRAQLAELESQFREMTIIAPTNSVLEVLSVKVGDVLAANQPVATLLLADHLWIRVYVPQPWLGRIKVGDTVTVRPDAFPGREFEGTIEQIGRQAEFTPRNVQTPGERVQQVFGVKVRLDDAGDELRAGMSAEVDFPAGD